MEQEENDFSTIERVRNALPAGIWPEHDILKLPKHLRPTAVKLLPPLERIHTLVTEERFMMGLLIFPHFFFMCEMYIGMYLELVIGEKLDEIPTWLTCALVLTPVFLSFVCTRLFVLGDAKAQLKDIEQILNTQSNGQEALRALLSKGDYRLWLRRLPKGARVPPSYLS